jgi:hypothetical protein
MQDGIQAGGETLQPEIHEFINFVWNTGELAVQWKSLLLCQLTKRAIKVTVVKTETTH